MRIRHIDSSSSKINAPLARFSPNKYMYYLRSSASPWFLPAPCNLKATLCVVRFANRATAWASNIVPADNTGLKQPAWRRQWCNLNRVGLGGESLMNYQVFMNCQQAVEGVWCRTIFLVTSCSSKKGFRTFSYGQKLSLRPQMDCSSQLCEKLRFTGSKSDLRVKWSTGYVWQCIHHPL